MRGIGRAMPFTMIAFFTASLSVIGLPPLAGLWSKWYLALGSLQANEIMLLCVLMVSSVATQPQADIREWGLLPEQLVLAPMELGRGRHEVLVDGLIGTQE